MPKLIARLATLLVGLALTATAGYLLLRDWHELTIEQKIVRYDASIRRHAQANRLPPELVRSVIRAESGGDPDAVSAVGARGLMQLMAPAEQDVLRRQNIAPGDLHDPDYNIQIGTGYLRQLLDRFDGDLYLALAAYHMGPTRVAELRRDNPSLAGRALVEQLAPEVTRRYCDKVLGPSPEAMQARVRQADGGPPAEPS